MIIGIKNTIQDPGSCLIIKSDKRSTIEESRARISRTPTLDLGVVIDNQGYVIGDRVIKIEASLNQSDSEKLWSLYKNNLYLLISTRDGIFYGSIYDMKINKGKLEMTFYVKE